jgi:hypothetical protein
MAREVTECVRGMWLGWGLWAVGGGGGGRCSTRAPCSRSRRPQPAAHYHRHRRPTPAANYRCHRPPLLAAGRTPLGAATCRPRGVLPDTPPPSTLPRQVYNLMLRRFPLGEYEAFKEGGNGFATTIAVLASAVAKVARATKLPPGLALFRGLGGLVDLPEAFWRADANGCRGYTEYGFMSTTSHKATALEYSGAKEKRPKPTARRPSPPRNLLHSPRRREER